MVDHFLKHSKIQYIPLYVNHLKEGEWQRPFYDEPAFYFFQNQENLAAKLSHFQLPEVPLTPENMENSIAVLALNFKVKRGYFRFLTAKYIGEKNEGHYQIFWVTKKYFPKRVLHFAIYTEEGKKISWENVEII